jgi:hypothetical protein
MKAGRNERIKKKGMKGEGKENRTELLHGGRNE